MNVFAICFIFLLSFKSFSSDLPCKEWQISVEGHTVNAYVRADGTSVQKYSKETFCREKWKNADFWGSFFSDSNPKKWPYTKEHFLRWTSSEKLKVIQLFSNVPVYLQAKVSGLYRAKNSVVFGNPSSTIVFPPTIVFYNSFFKNKKQSAIIVHELAHLKFETLSLDEKIEFMTLAGWTLGEINLARRKIDLIPPTKIIKPDSSIGIDEDFANHMEMYITESKKLERVNKNIYNFFKNRFMP